MHLINTLTCFIFASTITGLIIPNDVDDSHPKYHDEVQQSPSDVKVFELVNGAYLEKRRGGFRSSGSSISSSSSSGGSTKGGSTSGSTSSGGSTKGGSTSGSTSSGGSTKGGSTSGTSSGSRVGSNSYAYQCGAVSGRHTCGYGPYYAPTAAAAAAGYGTARYHGLRNTTSQTNSTETSKPESSSSVSESATPATTSTSTKKSNGGMTLGLPSYGTILPIVFAL
ncbi:uncharacterized protein SPAPADRAFT_62595, partial [Spathaspora passalidarum NRRL Y-27907]